MHLEDRAKDRYYRFYASFSQKPGQLVGRVFYEGKQGLHDGELEIEGVDLLSDGDQLDKWPKDGDTFLLRFHTKCHVRVKNKTELERLATLNKVSEYRCSINNWLWSEKIRVSVEIGDEGKTLVGFWVKH